MRLRIDVEPALRAIELVRGSRAAGQILLGSDERGWLVARPDRERLSFVLEPAGPLLEALRVAEGEEA